MLISWESASITMFMLIAIFCFRYLCCWCLLQLKILVSFPGLPILQRKKSPMIQVFWIRHPATKFLVLKKWWLMACLWKSSTVILACCIGRLVVHIAQSVIIVWNALIITVLGLGSALDWYLNALLSIYSYNMHNFHNFNASHLLFIIIIFKYFIYFVLLFLEFFVSHFFHVD